jgi:microcystin-dependent protein
MPVLGVPSGVPSGTIAIWTGSLGTIPSGWKLCDGTLGTPDLRNRFPKCVPDGVTNPGTIGGSSEITLLESQIPAHIHAMNIPNHEHKGDDDCEAPTGSSVTLPLTGDTSTGEFLADISSTESVSSITSTGNDVPHNNIPRCKDVLYIQKT